MSMYNVIVKKNYRLFKNFTEIYIYNILNKHRG